MPSSSHSRSGWTGYDGTQQTLALQARGSQGEACKYSSKSSSTLPQTVSTSNVHWQQSSKPHSTSGNQSIRSLPSSCYIPVPQNIQSRQEPSSSISSVRNAINTSSTSFTPAPHLFSRSLPTVLSSTPRPSLSSAPILSQPPSLLGRAQSRPTSFKRGSSYYSRISSRLPGYRKPTTAARFKLKKN